MCLIIVKETGVEFPNEDILAKAFKANPDGAGLAYNKHDHVYIHKGYMTYQHFIECYRNVLCHITKDSALVIHFRKASRGKVNPELTHPFPISDNLDILTKSFLKSDYAVVHNGTIKEMDKYLKKERRKLSDTIVFVQKYLSLIANNDCWFDKECNQQLLELLLGDSRMCILNNQGEIRTVGNFFKYNDLLFSKQSF